MAQAKKPRAVSANNVAYAIVCNNQSALKLDELTPNFSFDDGEIKDVQTNEEAFKSDSAVEKSIRYVPNVHTICMDQYTARYACLNLIIKHQGTGAMFHVEEVVLDDTSRPEYNRTFFALLDKVEVKRIPTSDDSLYEEDIFGDDGQD